MGDPLKFEPVKPLVRRNASQPPVTEHQKAFWKQLLSSCGISVGTDGTDKKTGKRVETVSITGHAEF